MMAWISCHRVTSNHRHRINAVDPKHLVLGINHFDGRTGVRAEPLAP
jgi:hypothetical protein